MDLQELVDRLEELVQEGRSLPFIRGVLVDEERLWDLIDQMRISIPEEVRKAQQLLAQKDRIIAQAQERARRILQRAQEEREALIAESEVVQAAQAHAEEILNAAHEEAERIRREAEEYALRLFREAARNLEEALRHLQASIAVLERSHKESPDLASFPSGDEAASGDAQDTL